MFIAHDEMLIHSGILFFQRWRRQDLSLSKSEGDDEIKGEYITKSVLDSWGQ